MKMIKRYGIVFNKESGTFSAWEQDHGKFVMAEDHLAELSSLQKQLDMLHGQKFSDRCYHALKYRAETAESELSSLRLKLEECQKDAALQELVDIAQENDMGYGPSLEQIKRDAARYRWLRDEANGYKYTAPLCWWTDSDGKVGDSAMGAELDSAIDTAIDEAIRLAEGKEK